MSPAHRLSGRRHTVLQLSVGRRYRRRALGGEKSKAPTITVGAVNGHVTTLLHCHIGSLSRQPVIACPSNGGTRYRLLALSAARLRGHVQDLPRRRFPPFPVLCYLGRVPTLPFIAIKVLYILSLEYTEVFPFCQDGPKIMLHITTDAITPARSAARAAGSTWRVSFIPTAPKYTVIV